MLCLLLSLLLQEPSGLPQNMEEIAREEQELLEEVCDRV